MSYWLLGTLLGLFATIFLWSRERLRARQTKQQLVFQQQQINELMAADMRMHEALKVTHIAVWEWDVKHDIWYASPSYFSMLGYEPVKGKADREKELEKVHPEDRPQVIANIQAILKGDQTAAQYRYEARLRHANGEYRWVGVRCTVTEVDEEGRPACLLGVRIDIDERKKAEQQVEWLAEHDSLTSLANRSALFKHFSQLIKCTEVNKNGLALLFVDLDRFKNINDTMGHRTGDQLLVAVANRMSDTIGKDGFVARQGGDEFIILLPYADEPLIESKVKELNAVLSERYQLGQQEFVVTSSIGISLFPRDGREFDTLYKHADTAMFCAKKEGRNRFTFFTQEMQARSTRLLLLENALHHAQANHEFYLVLQPQMALDSGRVVAAEVLLRWHSKSLGSVSPAEFIPVAEDTGQIQAIGEWVIRETARLLRSWIEQGIEPIKLAVNLSVVQFQMQNLPELLENIIQEYQIPASLLEMELTERGAMADPDRAIETMVAFQKLGIETAIDDFGTGYSSLSYLQRFPVYKLKIDQSFIRNMTSDASEHAIVSAIIMMAHQLDLIVIAEGVETKEQMALLSNLSCDEVQGYYLSKPIVPTEFRERYLFSSMTHESDDVIPPQ